MIETKHEKELDGRKLRLSKFMPRTESEPATSHPTVPEILVNAITKLQAGAEAEVEEGNYLPTGYLWSHMLVFVLKSSTCIHLKPCYIFN